MKPLKADMLMGVITLFWGFTFIFTKLGIEDINESLFVILRFFIAAILVVIFFGKHLLKFDKDSVKAGVVLGLLYAGGFILQTYGLKFTTVPKSAFITGLAVPMVPFVYWLLERREVQLFSKIGVFIASIGLWIFSRPDLSNINLGDLLTLISTIFWAIYISYMDIFTRNRNDKSFTVQVVFLQFAAIVLLSSITYFIFDFQNFHLNLSTKLISALIYNGVLASFVVTFIHTAYQKYTTPVKAALIFSLEPVIASIASIFVFSIKFSIIEIVGAMIMILGVLTSEIGHYLYKKVKYE